MFSSFSMSFCTISTPFLRARLCPYQVANNENLMRVERPGGLADHLLLVLKVWGGRGVGGGEARGSC